jgi:acetyl-CoA C-acetyltransferase
MGRGKLAIVGVGEVPTGWFPERGDWEMINTTCMEAIRDAGLDKNDIEGVISVNPMAQPKLQSEIGFGKIPEELGLKGCKDICIVNAGGATTTNCIRMAEHWVNSGIAKTVLINHVTRHSGITLADAINFFATAGIDLQWEYPFGMSYNGVMALQATRYMHDTGTTPEQLASVCVANRKWAMLDPNARFRKPLTIEQVLKSRMVSTPLHAFECNVLSDGAAAMVVTSGELAPQISKTPVYKLGEDVLYLGATATQRKERRMGRGPGAAQKALAQAGLTLEDMDILEIYFAYPHAFLMLLEALGVCKPGEAGRFVMDGHTSPGGKLPCSTIGELSRGHTGSGVSTAYYVECARQLMGKAGDRQVPNARYLLTNAAGGSGMNMIWSVWGRDIP